LPGEKPVPRIRGARPEVQAPIQLMGRSFFYGQIFDLFGRARSWIEAIAESQSRIGKSNTDDLFTKFREAPAKRDFKGWYPFNRHRGTGSYPING